MRKGKSWAAGLFVAGVCWVGALAAPASAQVDVAMLEISGSLREQPGPLDWLSQSDSFSTLASLTEAIERVSGDPGSDVLFIRLKDASLSTGQIEEIGASMRRARDAGKRVHVFAENYANQEILLASYADEAIVQAGGSVSLSGLYMEEIFLRDTLGWLGIRPDMVQVGDYKGANEMFMRSEPSDPWEQNISQLLDSMYGRMLATLGENLGLSEAQLEAAMEAGWFYDAAEAIEAGLIDAEVDLPELTSHLEAAYSDQVAWRDVKPATRTSFDPSNPFAMLRLLTTPPQHRPKGDTIAVVHVVGAIVDGDSGGGGLLGGESVGSRTIRRALEDILAEDQIKGIVVRIDSPGGSAIASEVMWQGLRRAQAEKPVWVSVGSMAASGGYYTAVGGQRIYVNPSSIVGSIGVVGGKFTMSELYRKLRVNVVPRARGPRASLLSSVEPWSHEDRLFVRAKMTEVYDLFVSRVEAGRPGIDIARVGEGRLFTGDRAVELGMADRIGSLDEAVDDLASELGLAEYDVMNYPGPKGLNEVLEEMFGGMAGAPGGVELGAAAAARELLGPRAWRQVSNAGRALLNFRTEPVQAVMPRVILFE
jgi:protease IV